MLSQLEKNQEILLSMQDEALFWWGILREMKTSLLNIKRVLDTFEATQEVPQNTVTTQEEYGGSHQNSRRSPVSPTPPKRRVRFPASSGKVSRRSCRTSKGGDLQLTLERNSRGETTKTRCPNELQIHLTPLWTPQRYPEIHIGMGYEP